MQTEGKGTDEKSIAEMPAPEPVPSRGSVSLRARNLKNSSQRADRLVYSERNVPVNTKRRVEDNINMRDHVREQNIVDGHGSQEETSSSRMMNLQRIKEDETRQANENGFGASREVEDGDEEDGTGGAERDDIVLLERNLADIRLAKHEEAAANAEIQRVASLQEPSGVSLPPTHHHNNQSLFNNTEVVSGAGGGGGSETRTSSRQSRLQRTCQEQSFHIGQNEYPAEPIEKKLPTSDAKMKSSAISSSHASPQSRVYNNLFSESPDFILTTGKPFIANADDQTAREQLSSKEDKNQRQYNAAGDYERGPGGMNDSTYNMCDYRAAANTADAAASAYANQAECYQNHQAIGGDWQTRVVNDHECRVAKLDERFQYVGSKSGHKYFVEKILNFE